MDKLSGLQPENVFKYFEEICNIPHGSGNTKQISDYLVKFAKQHDLEYVQDKSNNVVIVKEATVGYENSPTVMIQGHMDMVCEKTSDSKIDFSKDGLELVVDGDFVYANKTTLGGDDGIAVAYALAILSADDIAHPRIEAIFTVDEEIGLLGAADLDMNGFLGKYLLNIDSEEEGILTVGCAGGLRADCIFDMEYENRERAGVYEVTINGLLGGHSGAEIQKERANSNILMGRLLYYIAKDVNFSINSLSGGNKDNAIPRETRAVLVVNQSDLKKFESRIDNFQKIIANEYKTNDSGIEITVTCIDSKNLADVLKTVVDKNQISVLTSKCQSTLIFVLMNVPNGVMRMSADIKGLVQTSLNLGILELNSEKLKLGFSVRSSVESEKKALDDRLRCLTEFLGGKHMTSGDYPGWEYKKDSKLRDVMVAVYEKLYQKKPKVEAIHAGLECGILVSKKPDLDCISFGPDMYDIHTVAEKLSISSTERVWNYLLEVLRALK